MLKLLILNNAPKNAYDKIFKIIDKHTTFMKYSTENEYKTEKGYVLEFHSIPSDALHEIAELKYIEEL